MTLLFWIVTSLLGSIFVYCFLSMFSADSLAWAIPVTLVLIGLGVGSIFLIRYLNNKKVKVA